MSNRIEKFTHKNLLAIVKIQKEALEVGLMSQLPYGTRLRYLEWLTCHQNVATWVATDDTGETCGLLIVSPTHISRPIGLNLELACTATAAAFRKPKLWSVLWHELRQGKARYRQCQRSISLFAVAHAARSGGIGSQLLDIAIRNEIAIGTTTLCTSTHNLRLVEHYRKERAARVTGVHRLLAYTAYDLIIELQ